MSGEWEDGGYKTTPKVIQITTGTDAAGYRHFLYALKDDGSIWIAKSSLVGFDPKNTKWTRVSDVNEDTIANSSDVKEIMNED